MLADPISYSNVLKNIGVGYGIDESTDKKMNVPQKSFKELERIVRGISNHRRLQILDLLSRKPELSVIEISNELRVNFKTIAEHIRRLEHAWIVIKRPAGNAVRHKVTERGRAILMFLRTLE